MAIDIKQHCEHVAINPVFGCLTCPYHVDYMGGGCGCYFEYTGGKKPLEWELGLMGSIVPKVDKKKQEILVSDFWNMFK